MPASLWESCDQSSLGLGKKANDPVLINDLLTGFTITPKKPKKVNEMDCPSNGFDTAKVYTTTKLSSTNFPLN